MLLSLQNAKIIIQLGFQIFGTVEFMILYNFCKVVKGLDNFLFKLVILRAVKDHSGNVWRRKPTDMYVVEITTDKSFETLTAEDVPSEGSHTQVSVRI